LKYCSWLQEHGFLSHGAVQALAEKHDMPTLVRAGFRVLGFPVTWVTAKKEVRELEEDLA